jgi:hypothetical protein
VLEILRSDESLQIDGMLESLETQLTSSEVITALLEPGDGGADRLLPGKNQVPTPGERNRSEPAESERLYAVFV